jgi:hypothetical protein
MKPGAIDVISGVLIYSGITAVIIGALIIIIAAIHMAVARRDGYTSNPLRRGGALAMLEAEIRGLPYPKQSDSLYDYRFSYDPNRVPGHEVDVLDLYRDAKLGHLVG